MLVPAHNWLKACLDGTVRFVGEPFSSNNCGFESSDVVTIYSVLTHDAPQNHVSSLNCADVYLWMEIIDSDTYLIAVHKCMQRSYSHFRCV